MAAVEVTISGMLYDKLNRTTQNVVLIGEATLTGLGVGGGPMPPGQGGGGSPPGIWGPPGPWPGWPADPGIPGNTPGRPPGIWGGGNEPFPTPPIFIPPNVPPPLQPPQPPAPGSPTTPVPPPEGSGGWPVNPVVPPPYIVVNYPGIGPVTVAPPASPAAPTPSRGSDPSR